MRNRSSTLTGSMMAGTGAQGTGNGVPHHVMPIDLDPAFAFEASRHDYDNRRMLWMHVHDVFEIGLCERGGGVFSIEDKVLPFAAGDVFLINHREFHHAYYPEGHSARWVFMSADIPRLLGWVAPGSGMLGTAHLCGPAFPNRFRRGDRPDVCRLVDALVAEAFARKPGRREMIRALLLELMVGLNRRFPPGETAETRQPRSYGEMAAIGPALDAVARRFSERLTVPELARSCHMSVSHFRRRFTALMGRSPQAYLLRVRISQACLLLESTDRPVSDIAYRCGFESLSNFNRQFQMQLRTSPRLWRSPCAAIREI